MNDRSNNKPLSMIRLTSLLVRSTRDELDAHQAAEYSKEIANEMSSEPEDPGIL
jgi:hypothetical protein